MRCASVGHAGCGFDVLLRMRPGEPITTRLEGCSSAENGERGLDVNFYWDEWGETERDATAAASLVSADCAFRDGWRSPHRIGPNHAHSE